MSLAMSETTKLYVDAYHICQGFIQSLAEQKGVDVDTAVLNKGDASAKINELKNMPAQGGSGSTTSSDNKQGDAIAQPTESWTTGDDPATQKQRGYSECR